MAEAVKTRIMPAEVVIHPFGDIDEALLNAVQQAIEQRFHIRAVMGEYRNLPDSSYSQRRPYKSTAFLKELSLISSSEKIRLGIATVDFFVPELSFVFGEANRELKIAVVSVARLDPQFYGEPADSEKLTRRAIKEVMHELGHVFGLEHCERADCVMWFSNTLAQTDRKGTNFCRSCAEKIDC
jgi:archaemetzincin